MLFENDLVHFTLYASSEIALNPELPDKWPVCLIDYVTSLA